MSEKCLLCQSERVAVLTHDMLKCRDCSFFFVSLPERARQQASFHLISEQGVVPEHLERLKKKYPKDDHARKMIYKLYADRVSAWYGESVRALDIGASGGFFLNELEQRGASASNLRTLEVDPTYQKLTEDYFGYMGDICNIETFKTEQKFDLLTMFDVLEHVDKFWLALANMHSMLDEGGRLILKLPNGNWSYLKYVVSKAIGRADKIPWYLYLEPGGHLNYWNNRCIGQLEKAGFKLETFEYAKPSKQQFKQQYWPRMIGYKLNEWTRLQLFPEFIVTFKKVAANQGS